MAEASPHGHILAFAQRAQGLADVWLSTSPAMCIGRVWKTLDSTPNAASVLEMIAVAKIISRIAEAFGAKFVDHVGTVNDLHRRMLTACERHAADALGCVSQATGHRLSLASVARQCRVSPTHLSRVVRRVTGVSFQTHARGFRLIQAVRLLATTTLSAKEVAHQCAYSETAAMDHEFNRWLKLPPTVFRAIQPDPFEFMGHKRVNPH